MNFILAIGFIVLALIICTISTIITLIVGISIANYIGLTGIAWWAFIMLFWLVISSIIRGKSQ